MLQIVSLLIHLLVMLASCRPSTIPESPVIHPGFHPREGIPFIVKDNTYWYIKIYLPDIPTNTVCAEIKGKDLFITWRDDGRTTQLFERVIELVDGITMNDIDIHWNGDIIVFSIIKPIGL